jgi:hypothetical protein
MHAQKASIDDTGKYEGVKQESSIRSQTPSWTFLKQKGVGVLPFHLKAMPSFHYSHVIDNF